MMTCRKRAQADDVTTAKTKTGMREDEGEAGSERSLRAPHPADTEMEAEIGSATGGDTKVKRKIVPGGSAEDQDHPMNGPIDTKGAIQMMIVGRAEETARTVDTEDADHTPPRNRGHHPHTLIGINDGTSVENVIPKPRQKVLNVNLTGKAVPAPNGEPLLLHMILIHSKPSLVRFHLPQNPLSAPKAGELSNRIP